MTGDRARVADPGELILIKGVMSRWIARETGEERLAKRSKWLCTSVEGLASISFRWIDNSSRHTYGSASRASASNCSCSSIKLSCVSYTHEVVLTGA